MALRPNLPSLLFATCCVLAIGCQSSPKGKSDPAVIERQQAEAVKISEEAAKALEAAQNVKDDKKKLEAEDLAKLEKQLKEALELDPNLGSAHNNLGTVYFKQNRFYDAAWEYKLASKLMPTLSEPLGNLGQVYESAGKLDEAVDSYEQALKLSPDNWTVKGNLARTLVRKGERGTRVIELLKEVAFKDPRVDWQSWARLELERKGK